MPLCVENLTINDEEIDRSSKHEHCNGVISDTLNFAVSPNDQAPCYSNNCATDLHVSEKQNGNADVFVAPVTFFPQITNSLAHLAI